MLNSKYFFGICYIQRLLTSNFKNKRKLLPLASVGFGGIPLNIMTVIPLLLAPKRMGFCTLAFFFFFFFFLLAVFYYKKEILWSLS